MPTSWLILATRRRSSTKDTVRFIRSWSIFRRGSCWGNGSCCNFSRERRRGLGHVGGFVAGLIMIKLFPERKQRYSYATTRTQYEAAIYSPECENPMLAGNKHGVDTSLRFSALTSSGAIPAAPDRPGGSTQPVARSALRCARASHRLYRERVFPDAHRGL